MASPPATRPAKPARAYAGELVMAGLFFAAVLLAYYPALGGALLWDDDAHITKLRLRSLHGLWRIWFDVGATQQYYPVLHSAFWVEHRLWGDSVLGYHLANVALHAAAALLLVAVLRAVSFPAPVLAGLIFALHPVCVESVAWISEQKNTLSAAFYLGSALLYLRFDGTRRRSTYAFALALFMLALLTKTVTATLPAALLLVLWWRRGLGWMRDVLPLAPWLALGACGGALTAWAEARLIGAEGPDFSLGVLQRLLLAGRVVVFYACKVAWPGNLMFIYPRWSIRPGEALQWIPLAGILALLAALVLMAKGRRGPLAAFLFFVGTLFPALGFVNVYPFLFSFVADHFQYLACIGIIVPAAWGVSWIASRIPAGARTRVGFLLAVPAALGVLTWRQCRIYRDPESLYRATLVRNPSAWLMHYNLAVAIGDGPGRLREAISEYEATLALRPGHWAAHNNLASALLRLPGRSADAVAEYEEALRLNPGFAEAHNNLGIALGHVPGRYQDAVAHLREAVRIRPDYDGAHDNLGVLLMRKPGTRPEAVAEFEAAIRAAPDNAEYHYNLANALQLEPGRLPDAVAEYHAALRIRTDYPEAHSNLGAALARMPGRLPDAVAEYEAALRLSPASAPVHANLANALARMPGRSSDALAEYSAALAIDPSDAEAHNDLGVLLSDMPGRLGDAVAEFQAAVRLNPDSARAQFCLGIGLARTGDREGALRHLERAAEIGPGFEGAQEALDRLRASRR